MKLDRFDLIVWSVAGALALAILGVIALGDRVGARVVRAFPADGGGVSALGRIGLEFAQAMDTNSVVTRLEIEPTVPGNVQWEARQVWFQPTQPFQPGVTYTARLRAGALSRDGRAARQDYAWTFRVREPYIVYLSGVGGGAREVWRVPATGGTPEQLTRTDGRLYDFAVAPDGERIAYSLVNEARGADLWLMERDGANPRLLVQCDADLCTVPAWSPDGARLAFSREPAGLTPGTPNGPPRVWTVTLATGEAGPAYQDSQVLGYGPTWSPDGRRLAFFDGSNSSIRLLDLQTQQEMLIQTRMGTVGAWSPDGRQMVYNDLDLETGTPFTTLAIADFDAQTIKPFLRPGPDFGDYGAPAWSPDGAWIAISGRTPVSGPGKQLWLLRPDGSETRAVTDNPLYTFGGYHWDAYGRALVFQRFELNKPYATPEVLVWFAESGTTLFLAQDAATAEWLP
jgi:TolB protein